MKLKEKMATDYFECVYKTGDESHSDIEYAYLAGFEAARNMAKDLHNSKRVNDCFTDSEDFLKLGEEEV